MLGLYLILRDDETGVLVCCVEEQVPKVAAFPSVQGTRAYFLAMAHPSIPPCCLAMVSQPNRLIDPNARKIPLAKASSSEGPSTS